MVGAVRAEFRKFFTTRLWWGMAIAVVVTAAAFAVLLGFFLTSDAAADGGQGMSAGSPTEIAKSVYAGGLTTIYLLMLAIGIMQIGSEYRHRTITSTFLALPARWKPMVAKVISMLAIGAGYGLITVLSSVTVGAAVLTIVGEDPFPSASVFRTLALSLLVLGLWALMGLGVGILIPNQVAALLIGVGVAWIVEPILGLALSAWDFGSDYISPYLPSSATTAIVQTVGNTDQSRLEWWVAALVLAAWAAVLSGLGIARTLRQDIS